AEEIGANMRKRAMMLAVAGLMSVALLVGCKTTATQTIEESASTTEDSASSEEKNKSASDVGLPGDVNLTIIATGNMYEAIGAEDIITGETEASSMAHVYTYVEQIRQKRKDSVILLDSGGLLHGSLLSDYWHKTDKQAGSITTKLMTELGFDVAAVQPGYDDMFAQTEFNWVSALNSSQFSSRTIIEKQGMRVGLCVLDRQEFEQMGDLVAAVREQVVKLKNDAKPHMIVLVLQHGTTLDGEAVAKQVLGLDLVITGDRKMTVHDPDEKKITLVGTQPWADAVAEVEVLFSWNPAIGRYTPEQLTAEMERVQDVTVSQETEAFFQEAKRGLERAAMSEIGYLGATIDTRQARFGDSMLVDMFHEAQLRISGADISFASAPMTGVVLPEGPLYVRDILYVMKTWELQTKEPWLYVVRMSGEEIEHYLEHSYGMWFRQMETVDGAMLRGDDFHLYDTAAGVNYVVDLRAPPGDKVNVKTTSDGKKFERDTVYQVVLNAFRMHDHGGYITEGLGLTEDDLEKRIVEILEIDMLEYFLKGEQMLGTIEPTLEVNWFASPKFWVQRASATTRD
ncbi:MAG: 5'-nucleotidase C-terminal domain-containing protein, partial [Spirochaetota bacterium]